MSRPHRSYTIEELTETNVANEFWCNTVTVWRDLSTTRPLLPEQIALLPNPSPFESKFSAATLHMAICGLMVHPTFLYRRKIAHDHFATWYYLMCEQPNSKENRKSFVEEPLGYLFKRKKEPLGCIGTASLAVKRRRKCLQYHPRFVGWVYVQY